MVSLITRGVGCEFDRFLYACVCDDDNGTPLTVLSALARMNVDPWEEAGKLMHMPQAVAVERLGSLLGALQHSSVAYLDTTDIAGPLVALLPQAVGPAHFRFKAFAQATPGKSPTVLTTALSLLTYVVFMLLGNWLMGNLEASRHRQVESAVLAAPTDPPATSAAIDVNRTNGGPP